MTRSPAEPILSQRALNRALLARQHLVKRRRAAALDEIEYLVGMQAQMPNAPYVGLWSRLEGFKPDDLATLIETRKAVRLGLMRNTIHLVSAKDCLSLWPHFQPLLAQRLRASPFAPGLAGADMPSVIRAATALLRQKPCTLAQLGRGLHERFPKHPANDLAYAARHLLPLIQIPPRGVWGKTLQPTWSTAGLWLGRSSSKPASLASLVLRYLAGFGPASVADIAQWSGLSGLGPVVDGLRDRLIRLRDVKGRQLVDLPHAPRPDAGLPIPPRFLPEYDNILLGHQDRTRVIAFEYRHMILNGTFLLDGFVAGIWTIAHKKDVAELEVSSFRPLEKADRTALGEEGERLLSFASGRTSSKIAFAVRPAPNSPQR